MNWQALALCKGMDNSLFYGNENGTIATKIAKQAKAICRVCPVSYECLTFAFENDEQHGIWGGFTAKERKAIIREYGKIEVSELRKVVSIYVKQVSD
jgi:WhiB family redox-sensing transcriptional regulator